MDSAADIPTVPADLSTKFQTTFYQDVNDSVLRHFAQYSLRLLFACRNAKSGDPQIANTEFVSFLS